MSICVRRLHLYWRGAVLPLVLLAAWEAATRAGLGDPIYTPPPSRVLGALASVIASGELPRHALLSLERMAVGLAAALLTAVPLGLIFGAYGRIRRWVEPVFEFIRPVPAVSIIPLVILLFGIGLQAKAFLVGYACFWSLFLNSIAGVRDMEAIYPRVARVFEIKGVAYFRKVVLPGAMPHIVTGIRLALAESIIVLMVAEMVGATGGLGYFIINSERLFKTANMLAGILAMAIIGFGLNLFADLVERLLLRHRERVQPS